MYLLNAMEKLSLKDLKQNPFNEFEYMNRIRDDVATQTLEVVFELPSIK